MYLADHEIKALTEEMDIRGTDPNHPFEPERQIQPCSIDLRVSDVFWEPHRRRWLARKLMPWRTAAVDLGEPNVHALNAFRDWKKVRIREGQKLTIRPGQTVMTRIYERFQMPHGCAGKIEGRSSFARLGLSVHCTGDFINPGWDGFMPLQLTNHGPLPIRIAPFFPICQLMIVRLAGTPERTYGSQELRSKYVNDDGGPSLWWRDGRIKQLQERLAGVAVGESVQAEIVEKVRYESPTILRRLTRYAARARGVENAAQILDDFSHRERRLKLLDSFFFGLPAFLAAAALTECLATDRIFSGISLVLVVVVALSLLPALVCYERREDGYLGPKELRGMQRDPPDRQA